MFAEGKGIDEAMQRIEGAIDIVSTPVDLPHLLQGRITSI
jgi:hypothetical protein